MPRVETVVPASQILTAGIIALRPNEIQIDPEMQKARPGPAPDDEAKSIEDLARSLTEIGQIVPVIVEHRADGYWLVDGKRRYEAAKTLKDFELSCMIRSNGGSSLQTAIHANLKRRGYTPIQLAHLFDEVRKMNHWTGTKEVAEYLGVSRAQVSQHDKLLQKPNGMDDKTYRDLISKVSSGKMGADAAFYTLTHVEAAKAETVLPRAQALAAKEASTKAVQKASSAPASSKAQEKTIKPKPLGPKPTAAERKKFAADMKTLREQHKKRVAEAKKLKQEAAAKAKVTKKHVQQAAREEKAIKSDLQRSIPDLRLLLAKLGTTAYPDVMRNFTSQIDAWTRGDATDRELITQWGQIAQIVESQIERTRKGAVRVKKAVKKAVKKTAAKKKK